MSMGIIPSKAEYLMEEFVSVMNLDIEFVRDIVPVGDYEYDEFDRQ
jgi:hypothetical protein